MTTLAAKSHDWVRGYCRRFSEATGWPLVFVPAGSEPAALALEGGADACWSREIHDGKRPVGRLCLDLPGEPEADRMYLTVCELAAMMADLLTRAWTTGRRLELRTKDLSALAALGRVTSDEGDFLGALQRLLRAAVELTGFRAAAFFLLNSGRDELCLRTSHLLEPPRVPFPRRLLSASPLDVESLATGRALLRTDHTDEEADWLPEGFSMALCQAVTSEAGPLGTLWLFDRRRRMPADRELHVLESLAVQVGSLLERMVLLQESAAGRRIERDLRIASESQTADVLRELPPDVGFEAAALCTSRHEVGGDLCELVPLDGQRTLVAVGDASGDSIPAALVMSAVRGAVRGLSLAPVEEVLQTDRVMERINRALHSITPDHQFMSLLYGVLDTAAGTFTYTNAGHPSPLHVQHEQLMPLHSHGLLLGVVPDAAYERSVLRLAEGDLLVLFSDGITEAMCRRQTMFRSDGIEAAIRSLPAATAGDIHREICARLESHTGTAGEGDDRTLLVIRFLGIRA